MELRVKQPVGQQMVFSLLLSLIGKKVLVAQLCPTLCDPIDCMQSTSLLCPWGNSPGKDTEVGSQFVLRGNLLIPGINLDFLHCRQIFFFYHLSHQGSPKRDHCWLKHIPWPGVFFYYNHHSQQQRTLSSPIFVVGLGTLVFPDLVKKDLPVRSEVVSCHSAARLPKKAS